MYVKLVCQLASQCQVIWHAAVLPGPGSPWELGVDGKHHGKVVMMPSFSSYQESGHASSCGSVQKRQSGCHTLGWAHSSTM